MNPTNYTPAGLVIEAVKEVLLKQDRPPEYITFSGNGEATLHPDFPALVESVIRLRDLYAPSSKTAVLSNGTHIGQKPIQEAMSRLDLKVIKLDCAEAGLFKRYNRPVIPFDLDTMVSTLRSMSDLTIQSLFTGGARGNYYSDHLDIWIKTIVLINPVLVQIYSLDRGYLSAQITPLSRTELQSLADRLKEEDIQACVF